MLALAVAQEAACRASGLPWPRLLHKRQAALAEAMPRVHLTYQRLSSSSLGDGEMETGTS